MSKNWLISYPHSGSNFIRYCIEFLTKKPTMGNIRLFPYNPSQIEDEVVLFRAHHPNFYISPDDKNKINRIETINKSDKIIFLVRDYNELLLRPSYAPLKNNGLYELTKGYRGLCKFYDEFTGDKLILYYEDIIENFNFVNPLINHYKLNILEDVDEFIKQEDYHRKQSLSVGNKLSIMSDAKNKEYYQQLDKNKKNKIMRKEKELTFKKGMGDLYHYVEKYKLKL